MCSEIYNHDGKLIEEEKRKVPAFVVWLAKNWKVWVPLVISGAAIIVAIVSNTISCRANRNAKSANTIAADALETSRYQFLQINRPYLVLSPKKFDNGQYWEINQKSDAIHVGLKYELRNVGNVAAKDIELPEKIAIGPTMKFKEGAPVTYKKPARITLGPGAYFIISPSIEIGHDDEETAKNNYKHLTSEESKGVEFLLSVKYSNELREGQKYQTLIQNRIHNDRAQVLKSEMLNLNEDVISD